MERDGKRWKEIEGDERRWKGDGRRWKGDGRR